MIDLQKAPYAKRMFAFLADFVVAAMLTVGLYLLFASVLDTDGYLNRYNAVRAEYEERYGVDYSTDEEAYSKMTDEEKTHYKEAVDAMNADEEANEAMRTYLILTFVILSGGVFGSTLLLEFIIPVILKDGRSLGKRLFGLGVMRTGFTRASAPIIFVRNVIGKGVMEFILPILTFLSVITGATGLFGWVLIAVFAAGEVFSLVKLGPGRFLHDVIADTVAVDWGSQMIFDTAEERDAYIEKQKQLKREEETY